MIHWELYKRLKFDHTAKWYMHKPESILENETHKILWDLEIQRDHLVPIRRPELVLMKKKKKICCLVDFAILAEHRMKIKKNI